MRSLLAITVSTLALAGCVTENSYNGSNKPVVENKINNTGAARTRIALALQYLKTGNNSQAKYNLERAADFAPELPEVHYSLAYYYQQVDEPELADKAYQQALRIDPNDPNTLNNYGVFLCGIGEYDRAAEELLKAISIPSYIRVAESYENLALCAIEFDDFENAEKYLKSALSHSSQRPSSLISLAGLYYAKSDLHKAQEVVEKYEATGRVTPRALMLSYLIQQRMGHIEKAQTTAGIILQTYPGSTEAKAISSEQLKRTEFEILREKYRQSQLKELQISNNTFAVSKDQPKIRIVKKKAPPKTSQPQVIATNVAAPAAQPSATKAESAVVQNTPTDNSVNQKTIVEEPTKATTSPSTPEAAPVATQSDDITIVSFGAPKKPATKQQTTRQSQAKSNDASTVVFYEAEKDESVFNANSQGTQNTTQTHFSVTNEHTNLPMLNPSVPALNIPYHIIQNGENLFSISVRYNVKLQKILQWNGLKESDRVQNGTKIYLNDPHIYHNINTGDTLFGIATEHSVLIDQLMRWNKLSPDVALEPGHRLLLVDPNSYAL
ncbi:type IV pilus biogenesis/stability protein PilW [Pseudoalteromonas sp. L1]|uniref:type IV pilus biogenesis/stability protein PilW n=1 Tax=Pseudoalteromonas sp. L1 TaxID=195716 RepID=UPI001F01DAA0|nr:type IV pilus biogenesis/stability protein PilW [Pseudoalteromonas sp. L1]